MRMFDFVVDHTRRIRMEDVMVQLNAIQPIKLRGAWDHVVLIRSHPLQSARSR